MRTLTAGALGRKPSRRPAARPHAPLPPFDPDDAFGQVHTVLPPEQIIPPHFTDPLFLRGDFNGTTLDLNRWNPRAPQPLPFLVGANSTPLSMLMTPMVLMYPRYWQDADLTEHAERGHDDYVIAPDGWNMPENGFNNSPAALVAWASYVRSWGFRLVLWNGNAQNFHDLRIQTLLDAGLINFYIHGKEVDLPGGLSGPQYDDSLHMVNDAIGGAIPIGAHFTASGERAMGYPTGSPRADYIRDWSQFNGRVHLMAQLSPWEPGKSENDPVLCSAGRQGASMYYARRRVNLGAHGGDDGALGPGAPDSRVIAFEIMATAQLYGGDSYCTEERGCLRAYELLCGTRDNDRCRPVSGSLSGNRYPTGAAI